MLEIKMIASDMDDTLLNDAREITPRTAAAIQKAIDAGKVFTLASGRMYCSMRPYAEKLGLDVPLVSYNGALVKGALSGQVYVQKPLKLETALDLLAYIKENNYYVQVYVNDTLYVEKYNAYSECYSKITGIEAHAIGDELYKITEAPHKLLLMTESDVFEKAWKDIAETFKGRVDVTSSKDNYLELMEPGVNKWVAIKDLAEGMGIVPQEIMCVGDSNNDLCMVANAGLGVAVGNAKEEVQRAAKMITASNDNEGVALAIENVLTMQVKSEE